MPRAAAALPAAAAAAAAAALLLLAPRGSDSLNELLPLEAPAGAASVLLLLVGGMRSCIWGGFDAWPEVEACACCVWSSCVRCCCCLDGCEVLLRSESDRESPAPLLLLLLLLDTPRDALPDLDNVCIAAESPGAGPEVADDSLESLCWRELFWHALLCLPASELVRERAEHAPLASEQESSS